LGLYLYLPYLPEDFFLRADGVAKTKSTHGRHLFLHSTSRNKAFEKGQELVYRRNLICHFKTFLSAVYHTSYMLLSGMESWRKKLKEN
jgi:hypothetical protein